ncbi:MAG: CRISPR-associated helicase Cas3' [Candidatus Korarchaeota archaeon]|nr:CRISPR-associated helicase Cas3' [Candidatus Korarchaeota archaeon]
MPDLLSYHREVMNCWFGTSEGRPFVEYALEEISEKWDERDVFLVEAPTGYGKSVITATMGLYHLREGFKLITAFPLRTLLEDQFSKMLNGPRPGSSKGIVDDPRLLGKRYMHEPGSPFLIRPLTLTTLDTLSLTFFGLPPEELSQIFKSAQGYGTSYKTRGHFIFSWGSVFLSDLVLDEVHLVADETKSLNFLAALTLITMDNRRKVVLMSATVPDSLKGILRGIAGNRLEVISFSNDLDREFVEGRCGKEYGIRVVDIEGNRGRIREALEEGLREGFTRAIVIFNTATGAIEFFKEVKGLSDMVEGNVILLHSRFTSEDRKEKLYELQRLKERKKPFILVTTQVIEAGVDISSDLMISELAPANSLIQRLGRFLREEKETNGNVVIWYDGRSLGSRRYGVYEGELVRSTLNFLVKYSDTISIHLPNGCPTGRKRGFSELINLIYEGKYSLNLDRVNEMLRPFLNLEGGSIEAAKLFYELEGSFVREGLIVPVVPKAELDSGGQLLDLVVPLSFQVFKDCIGSSESCEAIRTDGSQVKAACGEMKGPRDLLKLMIREDVAAFIVDAEYSNELGLVW